MNKNQSIDPANMRCQLDPKVNPSTILNFRTEIGEMWGSACGRNRGVFVLDPPDGNTYGALMRYRGFDQICILSGIQYF